MTYSPYRAAAGFVTFLLVTGGLLPFYLMAYPLGRKARRLFAVPFYRCCLKLTGLRVEPLGRRLDNAGTLYVANHVSYLDIPVLAFLMDGLFVAKADVRGWPLFGFLARIAGTLFVSRQAAKIPRERLAIAGRLKKGENIFLFPEGSSSDGVDVLPFKAGLLSAANANEGLVVPVQPVSIVYGPAEGRGNAMSQRERDCYAWYGDMDMLPHLWRLFGTTDQVVVSVQFHPVRLSNTFSSRHELAQWAEGIVRNGVKTSLGLNFKTELSADTAVEASLVYVTL